MVLRHISDFELINNPSQSSVEYLVNEDPSTKCLFHTYEVLPHLTQCLGKRYVGFLKSLLFKMSICMEKLMQGYPASLICNGNQGSAIYAILPYYRYAAIDVNCGFCCYSDVSFKVTN